MTDELLTFTLSVDHNLHLLVGEQKLDAILQVAATESAPDAASGHPLAAEVIIIDTSRSMIGPRIEEARRAASTAVDAIRDGTYFAVIAGHTSADLIYPASPGMVPATARNRSAAKRKIAKVTADGTTSMSAWLRLADALLVGCQEAQIKHAVMLTDGYCTDDEGALPAVLKTCEGHFVCDCRGVGDGWRVEELRDIAHALLGTWKPVAAPAQLADDFREALRASMAKRIPGVVLRVRPTGRSRVTYFAQTMPSIENLTGKGVTADGGRAVEFPLGPWGAQSRDYHLRLEASQDDLGIETGRGVRAARIEVIVPGPDKDTDTARVAASSGVVARWTTDTALAREDPKVGDITRQEELNTVIWDGLDAWEYGRPDAEQLLGRALRLAYVLGRADLLEKLSAIASRVDPKAGVIKLLPYHDVPQAHLIWTRYLSTQSRTIGTDAPDHADDDD
jgi:hypothetical protein